MLVEGDLGSSDEHAEYAFLYFELEVGVTVDDDDLAPYDPFASVTWCSVMQLRNAANAVDPFGGDPVPPPNCEPAGSRREHALMAFWNFLPTLKPPGAPPPEGNVPDGAPPGGPPEPGSEILTPCFLRHFSNFLRVFLVVAFVAELDDADAALPPTTSPPPESATTSTTASTEQNRTRTRRGPCDLREVE